VTWLYGPLQTSAIKLPTPFTSPAGSRISTSTSFLNRKAILKKPSIEQSPATNERRHIHFNDKVEQSIAVDVEDGDDNEDEEGSYATHDDDNSSSDSGLFMMKGSSKPRILNQKQSKQFSEQL
jgi:hypothetical protein